MRNRRTQTDGFTLLELVLVMALLAALLAVTTPSLRGFWAGSRTKNAATELLAVIRYAHMQAVADSQVYRLNWGQERGDSDVDHWAFWLTAQDGTDFAEAQRGWGRHFSIPDGVELQVKRSDETAVNYIEFQGTGRVDPASLKIVDQGGSVIEIICLSPTEHFHIVSNLEKR